MRYLCFDLGDKRTGIAAGDDETGVVSPAGLLRTPAGEDLAAPRGRGPGASATSAGSSASAPPGRSSTRTSG
jgi:hypothetical protein